jgi:hypothetical protein
VAKGDQDASCVLDHGRGVLTAIPSVIAYMRKCKNLLSISQLSFFLSWTIIGWVVALAWAIWGESDPKGFTKKRQD